MRGNISRIINWNWMIVKLLTDFAWIQKHVNLRNLTFNPNLSCFDFFSPIYPNYPPQKKKKRKKEVAIHPRHKKNLNCWVFFLHRTVKELIACSSTTSFFLVPNIYSSSSSCNSKSKICLSGSLIPVTPRNTYVKHSLITNLSTLIIIFIFIVDFWFGFVRFFFFSSITSLRLTESHMFKTVENNECV